MRSRYADLNNETLIGIHQMCQQRLNVLEKRYHQFGTLYAPLYLMEEIKEERRTLEYTQNELAQRDIVLEPTDTSHSLTSNVRGNSFSYWHSSAIHEFLELSDCDLLAIDGAILVFKAPVTSNNDWGWHESAISLIHEDKLIDDEIPSDLRKISHIFRGKHTEYTDSIKFCVVNFEVDISRGRKLIVRTRPITYLSSYPVAKVLYELMETQYTRNLRTQYFSEIDNYTHPLKPNMLIAHVTVVTGDKKLLLMRRKNNLAYFPGHWSASFEEHYNAPWEEYLTPDTIHPEALGVDTTIGDGIRRGLLEEIYLTHDEVLATTVRVLGVGFEYTNFNTSIYAVAELPEHLTYDALLRRLVSSDEHDRIAACAVDIPTLLPALIYGEAPQLLDTPRKIIRRNWTWHPTARMRLFLVLCRYFQESHVYAAIEQEIRQHIDP